MSYEMPNGHLENFTHISKLRAASDDNCLHMEYYQMTHLLSLAVLNVYEMYVIHSNYNKFKVYKLLYIHIFQKPLCDENKH